MPRTGENIYRRKDGRWEGRYIKERSSARIRYGYVYGKSYREVKGRLFQIRAAWEVKQKASQKKRDDTIANIAEEWLRCSSPLFRESTVAKYHSLLRSYILPAFGDCPVSEITGERLSRFANRLLCMGGRCGHGLSAKTVADILSLFRSIQKYAAGQDMDVRTICRVPVKQTQKPLRVLTAQEQQTLCHYIGTHATLSNLGILLCLFTGIRIGELCALKWGDISPEEQILSIHHTMQRLPAEKAGKGRTKIRVSDAKSLSSVRTIPLPDLLIPELTAAHRPPDFFFLSGDPVKYVEPRTMQNRFKAVLKCCQIADTNFHTLRHTFATRCVEVGFDVKSLSEILGHANVNITLNRYVHPTLELKRKNMSLLSEKFAVR